MKELLQSMGIATLAITLMLAIFMASTFVAVVLFVATMVTFLYFILKVRKNTYTTDKEKDGPF